MKVLVFGGSGLVGSKFIELFDDILEIEAPKAEAVNILNKDQVSKAVEDFNPESVINFAAYTNVEEAEDQKDDKKGLCFQVNALGAKNVADACREFDKHLIHISTEYVFDGEKDISPYNEEDKPNPINWYGQTKLFAENYVIDSECKNVIVRISMPYTPFYDLKSDVARFFLKQLTEKKLIRAIEDQRITPILVSDIANGLRNLIEVDAEGIYHISAKDSVSPLEFAKTIAELFGLDYSLITSIGFDEYNEKKKAKLLKYSWLNPAKFDKEFGDEILHTVEEGLVIFKKEIDAGVGI